LSLRKPEINIGTLGHVDHGKTSIVKALTGIFTSRYSKEMTRNITIKLGYAMMSVYRCTTCEPPYNYFTRETCPKGHRCEFIRSISFVDAPGHEVLMTTMLSGAAIMDGALLVIAADEDCPQPQTREHLYAAKVLGLEKILVIQNKIDLVDRENAIRNRRQITQFLLEAGYGNSLIIPVSAERVLNIDILLWALERYFPNPVRDRRAPLEMPIIRSFNVNRPGVSLEEIRGGVIGGSITNGKLRIGDEILISPGLIRGTAPNYSNVVLKSSVRSVMFDGTPLDEADAGGLIAIGTSLDPALTKNDRLSGSVVSLSGNPLPVSRSLKLELNLFEKLLGSESLQQVKPVFMGEKLNLNVGVGTSRGTVTWKKGGEVELKLELPIVARIGQRATVSRLVERRWRLIGYGKVI